MVNDQLISDSQALLDHPMCGHSKIFGEIAKARVQESDKLKDLFKRMDLLASESMTSNQTTNYGQYYVTGFGKPNH